MGRHGLGFLLALAASGCSGPESELPQPAVPAERTMGSIEWLDPAFDAIAPRHAQLQVLAEGHSWTEGPLWVSELGGLLYSDIPANAIYLYRDGVGSEPWITPSEAMPRGSGGSNGLMLTADGRLLLAQHGDRRIAHFEGSFETGSGEFVTLAAETADGQLNSPNDLVQGPLGDLYFTDPPYGLAGGDDDPGKELSINGVYRISPRGALELVDDGLSRPNRIALSPDARTLYVASSADDERVVMAYDVGADGRVGEGRVFAETWGDGMAIDQDGNVYVAEPLLGVFVFAPDGRHIGSVLTGQRTSNVAWGDDGSTLYISADSYLMRVRLNTVGLGF